MIEPRSGDRAGERSSAGSVVSRAVTAFAATSTRKRSALASITPGTIICLSVSGADVGSPSAETVACGDAPVDGIPCDDDGATDPDDAEPAVDVAVAEPIPVASS